MILNFILGTLAVLSLLLLLWQWLAALRFPLHERVSDRSFSPAVTVFKPLKGADAHSEKCLRSWFTQEYAGPIQILLGVYSPTDTACPVINKLIAEFSSRDARLVLTSGELGTNGKVSNLAQLVSHAKHDVFVISDADVLVPPDFLANAVAPMNQKEVGLVNCFYRLANPTTLAMQWEAVAINADFWSQVLQSKSLKPLDFALGAVMVTRRQQLEEIGGFESLVNCLADDYQLGHRIAARGHGIFISPVVVECWDPPQMLGSVLKHQLRWARTIRVCQPVPYFFSILSNVTLWSLLWFIASWSQVVFNLKGSASMPSPVSSFNFNFPWGAILLAAFCLVRVLITFDLQRRITRSSSHLRFVWLAPIKDLLQTFIWACAFAGNKIEWRGQKFHLRKDGTLAKIQS